LLLLLLLLLFVEPACEPADVGACEPLCERWAQLRARCDDRRA
jgi:hypothetical protein